MRKGGEGWGGGCSQKGMTTAGAPVPPSSKNHAIRNMLSSWGCAGEGVASLPAYPLPTCLPAQASRVLGTARAHHDLTRQLPLALDLHIFVCKDCAAPDYELPGMRFSTALFMFQ